MDLNATHDNTNTNTITMPVREATGGIRFVSVISKNKKETKEVKKIQKNNKPIDLEPRVLNSQKKEQVFQPNRANSLFTKPRTNKIVAQYYFDSEDELEAKNLTVPSGIQSRRLRYEDAARKLVKQFNLSLDHESSSRLERIIVSRWKEIRNKQETKEVLMRDKSLGGMGLTQIQAQDIEEIIEKGRNSIARGTVKQSSNQTANQPSMVDDIFSKEENTGVKPSFTPKNIGTTKDRTKKIDEKRVRLVMDSRDKKSSTPTLMTEIKPRKGTSVKTEVIKETKSVSMRKPSFTVMGPVEEINALTLDQFRHLSDDPQTAAQKVYQKIDLLGDESLEFKAHGIKAWKESAVYQEYVKIGQQSMESKKTVKDVIENKEAGNMNMKEFEAIGDLNRKLAF